MKPTERMIEALDSFSELEAGRLSKNIRNMLLQFLTTDDACGNSFFEEMVRELEILFHLLDIIEAEQLKAGKFSEKKINNASFS
jgi:hypothetical protein